MFLESVLRFGRSKCHFFALENWHFWNLFAPLVKRHKPNSEKSVFWDTLVSTSPNVLVLVMMMIITMLLIYKIFLGGHHLLYPLPYTLPSFDQNVIL